MFLWYRHGCMSRRGSLPPTGLWLQPLRSHYGFTLAKQRERVSAFTLVELLIATGITVAMVLMLGWMLGSLMSSASHTIERVDAFRDARAALQVMERDLSNLVRTQWNPDPFANPTPTPGTSQPVTRPAAYFAAAAVWQDPNDPYTAGNPNGQIFGLISAKNASSATPTPPPGDVCAVGYYCRWDAQLHAYSLRRFFRDSSATFTALQNAVTYAGNSDLYIPAASDAVVAAYVWN